MSGSNLSLTKHLTHIFSVVQSIFLLSSLSVRLYLFILSFCIVFSPSQDQIREADEVNRIPLPAIPDRFGVRLPPLEYQTTLPNLQWEAKEEPSLKDDKDSAVSPPFPCCKYSPTLTSMRSSHWGDFVPVPPVSPKPASVLSCFFVSVFLCPPCSSVQFSLLSTVEVTQVLPLCLCCETYDSTSYLQFGFC